MDRNPKRLTNFQKDFIRKNRMEMYTDDMAELLGVTESQIINMLYNENLPRKTYRRFEKTERKIYYKFEETADKPKSSVINRAAFTVYDNPQYNDNYISEAILGNFHLYRDKTKQFFANGQV